MRLELLVSPRRHGVGERAGLVDGAQDLGQATRAPQLGDLLEDGPQLTRDLALGGGRSRIVDRVGAHPEAVASHPRADAGPLDGAQDRGDRAVGQLAHVLDVGDRADLGVAILELGDEEDAAITLASLDGGAAAVVRIEGKGHDGARQHNGAAQRHHRKRQHGSF